MTPELPGALALIRHVVGLLREQGIAYHLGGSYASSVHGIPRQTQDIDLVVDLAEDQAERLLSRTAADFYADLGAAREAVRQRSSFNLIHLASGIKVDLFVVGRGAFDRSEFERGLLQTVDLGDGRPIHVKTAEDTILRKLLWYRDGGEVSERQWADAAGILRAQGRSLDRAYLDAWAGRLGIRDLWQRLNEP